MWMALGLRRGVFWFSWVPAAAILAGRLEGGFGWALAPAPTGSEQARVDLFRTQVIESWINKRSRWKREAVGDKNWVDGKIRSFVPKSWIAVSSPAVVPKRTV